MGKPRFFGEFDTILPSPPLLLPLPPLVPTSRPMRLRAGGKGGVERSVELSQSIRDCGGGGGNLRHLPPPN